MQQVISQNPSSATALDSGNAEPRIKADRWQGPMARPTQEMRGALMLDKLEEQAAFERLAPEWQELIKESASDCIFLTWEWVFTWWKHLSAHRRLQLFTVRRGGKLLAVMPLALRPGEPARLFPFPALEFLGSGSVGSDYLDLIIRRGEEDQVLRCLVDGLGNSRFMLELAQVKTAGTHVGQLAASLRDAGWTTADATTHVCPYITLKGRNWEGYVASLGPSHRMNVRRRIKKLYRSFKVEHEIVSSEERRQYCFKTFLGLHHKRWSGPEGSDALNTQELISFHDEWSKLALERGWLQLHVLWLDGVPAASAYGLKYGDVFYLYQAGYDPAFGKYSVGLAMLGLTIKSAMEAGMREYDLLHGNESYKSLWTSEARHLARFNFYPPNVCGTIYRGAMELRSSVKRMIRWPRQRLAAG